MTNAEKPYRSPWLYDVAPFEIVKDVYYVGNKNVSVHLFDTGEGLLLLDTAYTQTGYLLLESIRELGFDPHDIKWILHSHAHYDHFGFTRMLVEKYGCKTYMPEVDLEFMTTKAEFNCCADAGLPYEPPYDCYFETDVAVRPGDVLQFGNIKVDCYSAAGHTPGTMAYVFHLPCGLKAAMHGGIGLNTVNAEYTKRYNLGNSWRDAYRESMVRLHGLEVDVVLGNHPSQNATFAKQAEHTADHNPFIDPTEWDRFLDYRIEVFDEMVKNEPV